MPLGDFGIYLTNYTTNETIELPVNPAEIKVKYQNDDKSQTIINLGEVNQLGLVKLTSLSIESSFPKGPTHYLATSDLKDPQDYIDFLQNTQKRQEHLQVVIAPTKISLTMTVSSFEYGFKNGNDAEYVYTLELKEWREFKAIKLALPNKKGKAKTQNKKKRHAPAKKVSRGSKVRVNGRLHADSYGRGAGMYEKNAKRTVIYIAPGRKYPICVGIHGVARGWVKRSDVKRI